MVAVALYVILGVIVYIVLQKNFIKGMTAGAVNRKYQEIMV